MTEASIAPCSLCDSAMQSDLSSQDTWGDNTDFPKGTRDPSSPYVQSLQHSECSQVSGDPFAMSVNHAWPTFSSS